MNLNNKTSNSTFRPAWWLRNPHCQTIWPALFRRVSSPDLTTERITLSDGDFLDLAHLKGRADRPLILILHGLEGSQDSHYIKGMLAALAVAGYPAVVMHFRGCSGVINKLARGYHSGETGDLAEIVQLLRQREKGRRIIALGYSLGGNVLLKYLGETGESSGLSAAAAVSVPLRLEGAAERLMQGASRFYQWRLLRQLRVSYAAKFRKREDAPFPVQRIRELDTFWKFDNEITAVLHGFKGVRDYYKQSSSRQFLKHIQIPTLILQAKDDPFMNADILPSVGELSDSVAMELSECGGHVGFVQGCFPGKAHYWLEPRLLQFFLEVIRV